MTDRPIIFSAPMVRALLDGRKTQTRRLAWRARAHRVGQSPAPSPWQRVHPGDRLWVRETWCLGLDAPRPDGKEFAIYAAEYRNPGEQTWRAFKPWRPSIHMPRWASRITLHVEAVRVERVQEISEADAAAEGAPADWEPGVARALMQAIAPAAAFSPHATGFARLWNTLHGPGAWEGNPEVVVLQFRVVKEDSQ